MEWISEFSTQLGFAGVFSLLSLYLMLRFFVGKNGREQRRTENGISVMEYLRTEIKPELSTLAADHRLLSEKVAALPDRKELAIKFTQIHDKLDTKQDKLPTSQQGES